MLSIAWLMSAGGRTTVWLTMISFFLGGAVRVCRTWPKLLSKLSIFVRVFAFNWTGEEKEGFLSKMNNSLKSKLSKYLFQIRINWLSFKFSFSLGSFATRNSKHGILLAFSSFIFPHYYAYYEIFGCKFCLEWIVTIYNAT